MSAKAQPPSGTDSTSMTQTQIQPAASAPAMPPPALDIPSEPGSLHALALASLDDDQAQELVSIPLEGKSSQLRKSCLSGLSMAVSAMLASKACRRRIGFWSMPAM
jgi:ribosome-associated protein